MLEAGLAALAGVGVEQALCDAPRSVVLLVPVAVLCDMAFETAPIPRAGVGSRTRRLRRCSPR
eukprot:7733128-Pyramimonas_sp.AAC.1